MKAIVIHQHGDAKALTYTEDFPKPEIQEDEVLVAIQATGLNQVDLLVRKGYPGITIPLPHIPGGDLVGVVTEKGKNAGNLTVGTRVAVYPLSYCGECPLCLAGNHHLCLQWKFYGLQINGGYAEFAAVKAKNLVRIPDSVSYIDAVCIPVAGLTAYHGIHTVAQLQERQTFMIWGGSGALGTLAIQIAKSKGAKVIATANSDQKLEVMKSLGADHVFNRLTDDIPVEIKKLYPIGVDVILDYVGPETFPKSFDLLKKGGKLLLCGIITGRETNLSIHMTYLRHLSIHGLYLGMKEEMETLYSMLAEGKIKPHIHEVYSLSEAQSAHQDLENGNVIGKIALTI